MSTEAIVLVFINLIFLALAYLGAQLILGKVSFDYIFRNHPFINLAAIKSEDRSMLGRWTGIVFVISALFSIGFFSFWILIERDLFASLELVFVYIAVMLAFFLIFFIILRAHARW